MIAIDWGTSSLRAFRINADHVCIDRREAALGIMQIKDARFAGALHEIAGDWLAQGETQVLMCGMIGSRQGWKEVPYLPCPAGLAELRAHLCELQSNGYRAWIVPGVSCHDEHGVPDVMRGEETQIIGALHGLDPGDHVICLPGTHSKWVEIEHETIVRFTTHMTGEVFALLQQHSILGRMMQSSAQSDDLSYFVEGVETARQHNGLLHQLFGVRSRGLFGLLPDAHAASFLSGLLLGHEIKSVMPPRRMVALLGAPGLTALYERALEVFGYQTQRLDPDCAMYGLIRLAPPL